MSEPSWTWRNCREIGFAFHFWPLTWRLRFERYVDVYAGEWKWSLGPFMFVIYASIGNVSSENSFEAWLGLSEHKAYERAEKSQSAEPRP